MLVISPIICKEIIMATERFIKFIPSFESDFLQENHPNAFLLLCLIAKRARRTSGNPDGLEIGEAYLGDHKKAGIISRQQYRTALDILIGRGHIKKIETCRTRKKSTTEITTGTTTIGTKIKLLRSDIWDINTEDNDHQINHLINHRPTTDQPRTRMNKNEKNENKKEKIEKEKAPEVPKIKFRDFVSLSQKEFDSLLALHGKDFLDLMLDELNSYKGRTGKEYKSDYYAMAAGSWLVKKIKEGNSNESNKRNPSERVITNGFQPQTEQSKFQGRILSIKGSA